MPHEFTHLFFMKAPVNGRGDTPLEFVAFHDTMVDNVDVTADEFFP